MSTLRLYGRLLLAVAAVALIIAVAGCGSRPAAIVNGTKITENDLNQRLRKQYGAQVLSGLINTAIIKDAFTAAKLTLTQEDVTAALDSSFGGYQQFQQLAAQQGINPQDYIDNVIKSQLMMEKLATKDLKVTDQALQDFYNKNKQRYDQAETVTYAVIVTSQKADAEKALAALKGGSDFGTVARQFSLDTRSRESGGEMPPTPVSALPKGLSDVLNGLKEGGTSGVVPVDTLWGIFKLEKRTPAQKFTFAQVKTKVDKDYRDSQLTQERMTALRDKLRQAAHVAVVDTDFQALNEQYRSTQIPQFGGEGAATGPAGAKPATPPAAAAPAAPPAAPAAPTAPRSAAPAAPAAP